ncbi:type II toxin-antitoxin system PemK/MazF family toxin [Anabaena azotica]|uniref:type II toxin-antitoxin system PemK/MazF family toxin n=1 Tax=Anabaena azotica TaxID=197653 RepID=UPI0039A42F00
MTPLQKGDIVLVQFPFTDLSQTKLRPTVVIWSSDTGQDITLCFISSQATSNIYPDEFLLDPHDPEFASTGLKIVSKVRVTRVITLDRKLIVRKLGKLGDDQTKLLNTKIIEAFQLTT